MKIQNRFTFLLIGAIMLLSLVEYSRAAETDPDGHPVITDQFPPGTFDADTIAASTKSNDTLGIKPLSIVTPPRVRNVKVILANFQNDVSTPYTVAQAQAMIPAINSWFTDTSFGLLGFTGDVHDYITLATNKTCDFAPIYSAVYSYASDHSISFTGYDNIMVVTNGGTCGGGVGALGGNFTVIQGPNANVALHELGHNLGLDHANGIICGTSTLDVPLNTQCVNDPYEDYYDNMGNGYGTMHWNAPHKEQLGWLNATSLVTVSSSGIYHLDPYEAASSTVKAIKIPSILDGRAVNYYVEHRRAVGYDNSINNPRILNGVLIHMTSNSPIGHPPPGVSQPSTLCPLMLDALPNTATWVDGGLALGETYKTPDGITFRPLTKDANGMNVQITFDPQLKAAVGFVSSTLSVFERAGTATLVVERKNRSEGPVSVAYQTVSLGSADATDFRPTSGILTWADGELGQKTITIPILDDTVQEPTESFGVELSALTGNASFSSVVRATVTIDDDDDNRFAFSSNVYTVSENAGKVSVVVNALVTNSTGTFRIIPIDGTAKATQDYTSIAYEITFKSGESSKSVDIPILNDSVVEPDEYFTVELFSADKSALGGGLPLAQAQVIIKDDDTPPPPTENLPPTASDVTITTPEDVAVPVTLKATDDKSTTLTYQIVSAPKKGTLSGDGANRLFTPFANVNGDDTFLYRANDGFLDSNVATVTIHIQPVNDPPFAQNLSSSTSNTQPLTLILPGSDVDGDALTFKVLSPPKKGSISGSLPNLTYTPQVGVVGVDTFTFTVSDGVVLTTGTVEIQISSQALTNHAPIAQSLSSSTLDGAVLTFQLSATDSDGDPLTYTLVSSPTKGSLSGTIPSLTYTPLPNAVGIDSFTFVASDGRLSSAPSTVVIVLSTTAAPPLDLPAPHPTTSAPGIIRNLINPQNGEQFAIQLNALAGPTRVTLLVTDRFGHVLRHIEEDKSPGDETLTWNGRDEHQDVVASGAYHIKIHYGSTTTQTQVVVLNK